MGARTWQSWSLGVEYGGRADYWSQEDTEKLALEYHHMKTWIEIAALFPGRSVSGVRHRAHKLNLTVGRRYNAGRGRAPGGPGASAGSGSRTIVKKPPIPEQILDDRDRRANEPRTLSQEMFGDPPFSQSALGRSQLG